MFHSTILTLTAAAFLAHAHARTYTLNFNTVQSRNYYNQPQASGNLSTATTDCFPQRNADWTSLIRNPNLGVGDTIVVNVQAVANPALLGPKCEVGLQITPVVGQAQKTPVFTVDATSDGILHSASYTFVAGDAGNSWSLLRALNLGVTPPSTLLHQVNLFEPPVLIFNVETSPSTYFDPVYPTSGTIYGQTLFLDFTGGTDGTPDTTPGLGYSALQANPNLLAVGDTLSFALFTSFGLLDYSLTLGNGFQSITVPGENSVTYVSYQLQPNDGNKVLTISLATSTNQDSILANAFWVPNTPPSLQITVQPLVVFSTVTATVTATSTVAPQTIVSTLIQPTTTTQTLITVSTLVQPTTTTSFITSTISKTLISITTSLVPTPVTSIVSVPTTTTSTISKTISKTATVIEVLRESCEFELFGEGLDCKILTSYSTITPSA